MIDKELLKRSSAAFEIEVDGALAEKLDAYARLLVEWNEKMNLTAITAPTDVVIKHFVDSLTAAPYLPQGAFSLIDVGTGAGFPGVPLALLRADCRLTLLDSLQKRLNFLEILCRELGIKAQFVHARAEEGGQNPTLRETFDVAAARAVAGLATLCEYCLPFVKVGGCMLALKGPEVEGELSRARFAAKELGGTLRRVDALTLPPDSTQNGASRRIVLFDKMTATPAKYPRPTAKIAKKPW